MLGAYLAEADLRGATLVAAKLGGARLMYAKFDGATLTDAQLQGAYVYETSFRGAGLSGVDFRGVDLTYVEGLTIRQMSTTRTDEKTKWPLLMDCVQRGERVDEVTLVRTVESTCRALSFPRTQC